MPFELKCVNLFWLFRMLTIRQHAKTQKVWHMFKYVIEIFAVEICMTLNLTFRMGQGQLLKCKFKTYKQLLLCWPKQWLTYLSPFAMYSQSIFAWIWTLTLECAKINCKYVSKGYKRLPRLAMDNGDVCSTYKR